MTKKLVDTTLTKFSIDSHFSASNGIQNMERLLHIFNIWTRNQQLIQYAI